MHPSFSHVLRSLRIRDFTEDTLCIDQLDLVLHCRVLIRMYVPHIFLSWRKEMLSLVQSMEYFPLVQDGWESRGPADRQAGSLTTLIQHRGFVLELRPN